MTLPGAHQIDDERDARNLPGDVELDAGERRLVFEPGRITCARFGTISRARGSSLMGIGICPARRRLPLGAKLTNPRGPLSSSVISSPDCVSGLNARPTRDAAAVAQGQVLSQFRFETAHLAAERRPCIVKHSSGLAEASQFGHVHEVIKLPEVHAFHCRGPILVARRAARPRPIVRANRRRRCDGMLDWMCMLSASAVALIER